MKQSNETIFTQHIISSHTMQSYSIHFVLIDQCGLMSQIWHAYMEPNSIFLLPFHKKTPRATTSWQDNLFYKITFYIYYFPPQSNSSRGYLSAIQKGHKWLEENKKKTLNHSDHSTWYKWLRPCHPPICPLSAAQLSWHALPALSNPNLLPSLPLHHHLTSHDHGRVGLLFIAFVRSLGRRLIPERRTQVDVWRGGVIRNPLKKRVCARASCWPHTLGVGTSDDVAWKPRGSIARPLCPSANL